MSKRLSLWRQILTQAALLLIAAYVLIPIWSMAYLAFDGSLQGRPTEFRAWPKEISLEAFGQVWERASQSRGFAGLMANSLLVSGGAALCAIVFGLSMAYAFARYRFPGRNAGLLMILVGALLPPVALMTPLYILLTMLKIRATMFGLMVVYTAFSMPFCIWNLRATFQAVPVELEESAFLDGANSWVSFWKIMLPLSLPSIAVAGLVAFLTGYSEFAMGWLFVEKSQNVTLAMAIYGFLRSGDAQPWSQIAALAILMSLPVVVIFMLLERSLVSRLLIGISSGEKEEE